MNTSIALTLDQRRAKKDGTYPLIFRLSHFDKTLPIPAKFSIHAEFWDDAKRRIKSHYRGTDSPQRLNNHLEKSKAAMVDMITMLADKNELPYLSIHQIKDILTGKKAKSATVFTYTQSIIDDLVEAKKTGTARVYKFVLGVLKGFTKGKDFSFNELNLDFIQRLERWHLSKDDNGLGGLSVYLRTIRALYNRAVKDGIADKDGSPFNHYKIRNGKPRKRAIPADAIRLIKNLDLEPGSVLERDRNIFLLSFHCLGMPYADLAHLTRSNIIDGRIFYKRQKTDEPIAVALNEQARNILAYFGFDDKGAHDFILPIIKRVDPNDQYYDIVYARKRYNTNLKTLAKMAGIQENLSSYVARHSFATIADDQDVPLTVISGMLGHKRISTTQVYLGSLRKNRLDDYQNKVTDLI